MRSTSRDARGGKGKRRSRFRSRTPTPRSTSKTRGSANLGIAAFNRGTQSLQHRTRWQPQQGHMSSGQQVRWADVAAILAGGVASADRSLGPAVSGGGRSELEQAIERALEQRVGPLQSIISQLKRENAILRAENSMLKGEALQSQPSQTGHRYLGLENPLRNRDPVDEDDGIAKSHDEAYE
ncbi:hypothetical protein HPB51_014047 [Rhipicephalus microplus]|uniref:Uncharacterized protein n=1 Tax=Rhipicephalus microplus TaxID=6941 RepID=A0A9J6E9K8_RHIMP|nr:hypothetical protein HPB51_014047 [Rhipicephalus microplus]